MTVTADYDLGGSRISGHIQILDGGRLLKRLGLQAVAVTLALVAVFIWLAPGATWQSDVMLFKLVLSIVAALLGLWAWQGSLPPVPATVELDVALAEFRLIREQSLGERQVMRTCAFGDFYQVDVNGPRFTFWDSDQSLLADVTLSDREVQEALIVALRAAGKLV